MRGKPQPQLLPESREIILVPEAQVADRVARLSSLPEVGASRTPAQVLPLDLTEEEARKIARVIEALAVGRRAGP